MLEDSRSLLEIAPKSAREEGTSPRLGAWIMGVLGLLIDIFFFHDVARKVESPVSPTSVGLGDFAECLVHLNIRSFQGHSTSLPRCR